MRQMCGESEYRRVHGTNFSAFECFQLFKKLSQPVNLLRQQVWFLIFSKLQNHLEGLLNPGRSAFFPSF